MTHPVISPLPPAPQPSDAVQDFEAKALEFVAELNPFGVQQNALADWMETTAGEVEDAKTAAEGAAATAAVDAAAAASAIMAGVTAARDDAEDAAAAAAASAAASSGSASTALVYKNSAEAAAAAAGAAAGLPALTGNAGKPLRVKRDGTGVAYDFGPVGTKKTAPAEPGLPIAAAGGDVIDCRASGMVIDLPTSPEDMEAVTVNSNGYLPEVDPGSALINGVADSVIIDMNGRFTFIYMADINTWRV